MGVKLKVENDWFTNQKALKAMLERIRERCERVLALPVSVIFQPASYSNDYMRQFVVVVKQEKRFLGLIPYNSYKPLFSIRPMHVVWVECWIFTREVFSIVDEEVVRYADECGCLEVRLKEVYPDRRGDFTEEG